MCICGDTGSSLVEFFNVQSLSITSPYLYPLGNRFFISKNIYQKKRTFTKYLFFFQHWEIWNQAFRKELPHVVGFHILRIDFEQLISLHFLNPQIIHIIYPLSTNIYLLYILLSIIRSQFHLVYSLSSLFVCCVPVVSVSISNLYPGCENVSVRSRSMMFEPSLTKGVLEVFSPVHNGLSTADDTATKAIDIQNANVNGKISL